RFSLLLNDMNIYNMKLEQFQVNTTFLNILPPEWSKFVTDVKLYGSPYQSQQYSSNQSSTPLSSTHPSNDYQSSVHHNAYSPPSSVPQIAHVPTVNQHQQQPEFPSLDSGPVFKQDALAEVHNPDNVDTNLINHAVQAMPSSEQSNVMNHSETEINNDSNIIPYSQYASESQQPAAQYSNSSAQQDALILSVIEQLKTQVVNCTKINLDNKSINDTLTAKLERYKQQFKVLKEGQHVALKSTDTVSDSCAQSVEIDLLKQTLSEHLK
nr:hypothetical protein [Tanacetum cinerariifolium]